MDYAAARNAAAARSHAHPNPSGGYGSYGGGVRGYPSSSTQAAPSEPSASPSLAVRLLQIAGEFESSQKREKEMTDERINALRARNQELEAGNSILREDLSAVNRQVARLEGELSLAGSKGEERLAYLEAELLATRFELADRTAALATLQSGLASVSGSLLLGFENNSENELPPAVSNGAGGARALSQLPNQPQSHRAEIVAAANKALAALVPNKEALNATAIAARETGKWSAAALVAAAGVGNEAALESILCPRSNVPQNPSGGGGSLTKALGTALLAAVSSGQTAIVARLLARGAPGGSRGLDREENSLLERLSTKSGGGAYPPPDTLCGHSSTWAPQPGTRAYYGCC